LSLGDHVKSRGIPRGICGGLRATDQIFLRALQFSPGRRSPPMMYGHVHLNILSSVFNGRRLGTLNSVLLNLIFV